MSIQSQGSRSGAQSARGPTPKRIPLSGYGDGLKGVVSEVPSCGLLLSLGLQAHLSAQGRISVGIRWTK